MRNWQIQDDRAVEHRDEVRRELTNVQVAIGGLTRDSAAQRQDIVEQTEKLELVAVKVDKLEQLVSAVKGVDWTLGRMWVIVVALVTGAGWLALHWWHSRP